MTEYMLHILSGSGAGQHEEWGWRGSALLGWLDTIAAPVS